MKCLGTAVLLLLTTANAARATFIDTFDATNRGYFRNDGRHSTTNFTTLTGFDSTGSQPREYHSFLVFDLSGVTTSVLTGELHLELATYASPDASQTFDLFDVSTSSTDLGTFFGNGSSVGIAIHNDLGSGNTYGQATVTSSDAGSIIDITLNTQAIDDMNAAVGGDFSIGMRLQSPFSGTQDVVLFSDDAEARTHQLELTLSDPPPPPMVSLPEPGSSAASLLLLFLGLRRRLKKRCR